MLKIYRYFLLSFMALCLVVSLPKPATAQQPIQEETIPAGEEPATNPEPESVPTSDPDGQAIEMSQEEAQDVGYRLGSVVASAVYGPLKVTYAGLGLLTGGLGYVLSGGRRDVAKKIIYPAVRGNYVITPTHLKGQKPVVFVASPPQPTGQHEQTQPAPPQPAAED